MSFWAWGLGVWGLGWERDIGYAWGLGIGVKNWVLGGGEERLCGWFMGVGGRVV